MGRQVRRVPKDWKHPRASSGHYEPMFDQDVESAWREWLEEYEKRGGDYADTCAWMGQPPDPESYRPAWPEETRTHLQMYETVSEGTPISPVMETPEELARWLVDNESSAFGRETADYESWLRVARGGYAPSAMITNEGIVSGVEALKDDED